MKKMNEKTLRANLLLLLASFIWGFAFVAQKVGANFLGAFAFNGIRFALGSLSLIPVIVYFNKNSQSKETEIKMESPIKGGILAGCVIFTGNTLQQIGLAYTTAGKAAFITTMYIVLVPLFSVFLRRKISISNWLGVFTAIIGLYFLSITESFTISFGDLLQVGGAFCFALHILLIDHLVKKVDGLKLSMVQFITCSIISLCAAYIFETVTLSAIMLAAFPLLYGGLCSVGIAYTLQIIGQKNAKPSHASLILSMESVFAAIGGIVILHEVFTTRIAAGCILMLLGILLSQFQNIIKFSFSNKTVQEEGEGA
ncbi:MAG: DMT family transporter [Solirubrobacterales bacterium]